MTFLVWVESLSFSAWMRESPSLFAFPMFLFLHTLGMSVVAGGSAVISFALLGMWPRLPRHDLHRIFPVLLVGFWLNAITGTAIFMKDASTYGRNPDFYIKLVFVAAGMVLLFAIRKRVFGDPALDSSPVAGRAKMLAWASLVCWFAAIVSGRLIAYVGPVAGL
jgi:hypothetical protein